MLVEVHYLLVQQIDQHVPDFWIQIVLCNELFCQIRHLVALVDLDSFYSPRRYVDIHVQQGDLQVILCLLFLLVLDWFALLQLLLVILHGFKQLLCFNGLVSVGLLLPRVWICLVGTGRVLLLLVAAGCVVAGYPLISGVVGGWGVPGCVVVLDRVVEILCCAIRRI